MSEVVHERIVRLVDAEGTVYDRAFVYAELRDDRRWRAFIEFLSTDEQDAVRTGTETTQSSLEDMADWAEHLEPVYLEGAFRRALRRDRPEQELTEPARVAATSVPISIETDDPELPMRLMGTNTLVPGLRREVVPGVVLGYAGSASEGAQEAGTYDFAVEIESEDAAGLLADVLFGELEATHGVITVDGAKVRPRRRAIKEALLGIPVR